MRPALSQSLAVFSYVFGLTVPQVRYLRTKPSFKSELPLLAVSKSKLYRMVIAGEIPAVRFWGNIRMTDLEQLVAGYRKKHKKLTQNGLRTGLVGWLTYANLFQSNQLLSGATREHHGCGIRMQVTMTLSLR